MFLADLGAEVIKVENVATGGDPARKTGPSSSGDQDSEYFQTWNMNKKSVTLDLRSDAGKAALQDLVMQSEVVLNNLRGDLSAKMGLDYKTLSKLKPSIVCVHLSAYGRDNERASWPGYDYLMQAEAGLMHLTGEPDSPPTRIGAPSMIDHTTGLTAMVGLLSALIHARETGEGCDVDTCLFDAALHQLGYAAIWYLNEGHVPERQTRSAHFSVAPVQTFPTADGWIFVMCLTDKFWNALLGVLEARGPQCRRALLDQAAAPTIARRSPRPRRRVPQAADEALDGRARGRAADRAGVRPREALESPFLRTNGMISHVPHPQRPDMRVLANPSRSTASASRSASARRRARTTRRCSASACPRTRSSCCGGRAARGARAA
jgi:crotonobetainyl-CoA:carnitine CoA-transferase CaiB-like acyl-CoA transferase